MNHASYRGPFDTIATKVPGLQFTELLPRQAAIADKFTVLRSMYQNAGGHPAGSMQLLSGRCGPGDFLSTIYHHLGIDASNVFIKDFNGRPTPIVDHGAPIPELIRG